MKRTLMKWILGSFLAVVVLIGSANPVLAAGSQDAVKLTLNKAVTDSLSNDDDVNWYKFTVTQRGYFKVAFKIDASVNAEAIDWGWDVEIYKASDLQNPIKKVEDAKSHYESPILPMGAGDYYIKVYQSYGYGCPVGCKYNISANFTATNYWEVEGNDVQTAANAITDNTAYAGTLYYGDDADWYKVNVTQNGYMQVALTIGADTNAEDIDWGWDVDIYDAQYQKIKSYSDIKSNFTSAILTFPKGTYYVKVYQGYGYGAPVDCTYSLKVNTVDNAAWESEYNDASTTADVITAGNEYKGTLYRGEDVDWYKVNINKTGYFQVKFGIDSSVNAEDIDWGWDVAIYNSKNELIKSYNDLKQTTTSLILPFAKGNYYIKVYQDYSYGAPVDCVYNLKVTQTASSAWESEANNTQSKADSISLNKKYNGLLTDANDVDWFKITTKKTGTVKVEFKKSSTANLEAIGNGWNVYVYKKSASEPVKVLEKVKSKGSLTLDLKKGTYYIKVCPNYTYSAPAECRYELKASFSEKPATVSIKSVKASKKKVTITWKKASKATGYYIYRSTSKNGKYTKIATISNGKTVKYVDKKVKKGKKYYYKIVAINKSNGVTAKGSYSKIKNVKAK